MKIFLPLGLVLLLASVGVSQSKLNLMPMPANVQTATGQLAITSSFSVAVTARAMPPSTARSSAFRRSFRGRRESRFTPNPTRQLLCKFMPSTPVKRFRNWVKTSRMN